MRNKTGLRLEIEAFIAATDKLRDDWLSLPYHNAKAKNKIVSMAHSMKDQKYKIDMIENDPDLQVIWIRRQ